MAPIERVGKGDGGGRVRGQLIERMLIEVIHRENDSHSGTMSPGDQCGERLAFIPVPAGTGLVQRSVGIDPDGEIVQRRHTGNIETGALVQGPVGNEAEDLVLQEGWGTGHNGGCGGGRHRGGRKEWCSRRHPTPKRRGLGIGSRYPEGTSR